MLIHSYRMSKENGKQFDTNQYMYVYFSIACIVYFENALKHFVFVQNWRERITVETKRKLVLKKDDIQLKKAINLTCIQVRTVRQAFM